MNNNFFVPKQWQHIWQPDLMNLKGNYSGIYLGVFHGFAGMEANILTRKYNYICTHTHRDR